MNRRRKRPPKKAIQELELPPELRNTWVDRLCVVGLDVEVMEVPRSAAPRDPEGFARKMALVRKRGMWASLSSAWDSRRRCYTVAIVIEDVAANIELATEIERVLAENGAHVLTNEFEVIKASLADEEG